MLQQMRASPHDARAQQQGIKKLQMFTKGFLDNAELGRQPGVLQVLIAAMTNHLTEYDVAGLASHLMVGILRHSPQLRGAAASAGATAAAVAVLQRWHCPGAAMVLGFLALCSADVRLEALRLQALEHLATAWKAEPVFRDNVTLAAFAVAQADGEAFLRLALQADWVQKLEERQQQRIASTYQAEIDELVKLVHKAKHNAFAKRDFRPQVSYAPEPATPGEGERPSSSAKPSPRLLREIRHIKQKPQPVCACFWWLISLSTCGVFVQTSSNNLGLVNMDILSCCCLVIDCIDST